MTKLTSLVAAIIIATAVAIVAVVASETCFYRGERVNGMNKICYYSCPSGVAAITVDSYKLCPVSIRR